VRTASIIGAMMVYFNETTRRYIQESYHLHTRRRENLNLYLFSVTPCYMINLFDKE
jgi:hypothetical protein